MTQNIIKYFFKVTILINEHGSVHAELLTVLHFSYYEFVISECMTFCNVFILFLPTVFSETMDSAQQLLRSQRDLLLNWTLDHPAPLLRWLRDAEVLSSAHYLSLLERSPSNAVAQALEMVCATEESSLKFLQVLREVQDYYCRDLQVWVERHCRDYVVSKPVPAPVKLEGEVVLMHW